MENIDGSDSHKLTRKDKDKYTDIGSQTDIRLKAKRTSLSEAEKEKIQQDMMKQLENIVTKCEHEKESATPTMEANCKEGSQSTPK